MLRTLLVLLIIGLIPKTGLAWQQTSDPTILGDFNRLFGPHKSKDELFIPGDPKTIINLEDRVSTPTKVTIGLQTNILGVVQGDFKTEVEYSREYAVSTLIMVEGDNADIIRQGSAGGYTFDPGGRRAVRICAISASLKLNESYIGRVFVATGGVQQSRNYNGTEEIRQTSDFTVVNPGETPEYHKKACAEFADKKYAAVMKSLKGIAASRIYWDDLSQCNPKEPVTRESVCGRWHKTLLPSVTAWTTPVCERRSGQRNYFCTVRSKKGGACPFRDSQTKKLLTSGMFEYSCATGLKCELTKSPGWFNFGKAECRLDLSKGAVKQHVKPVSFSHDQGSE